MTRNPLDTINERVSTAIGNAIVTAGIVTQDELPAITLEVPREKTHGDLATNAAMQLTKIAKRNPRQIAEEIIANLNLAEAGIEKAEIAGPGFINFKLDKSYLYPVLALVQEQGKITEELTSEKDAKSRWSLSVPTRQAACIWDMPVEQL